MKSAIPKRTRIVFLFLFGIVLPCLLLGYLAFRGVQNDRALLEKNRMDKHRGIAGQVAQAVDENIRATELAFQELLSEKTPDNPSSMIQQLENLKTSHPLIHEVFAIQRYQSIKFVGASLLYQEREIENLSGNSSPSQSVRRILQRGEQLEFQYQDYKRALGVYRQALSATSEPQIQADLLRKIGRVQKKSRQFNEAIETYRTIADNHSQIQIMAGIPLGLAARMEIGSLHAEMEDQTKALEAYMDLYRDLLNGSWALEKESYAFYSDRIQESITGIFAQESSAEQLQSLGTTFQELIEEENIKKGDTERLLLFQQNALAERELMSLRSEEDISVLNNRFTLDIGPNEYLVCLLKNRPADDEIWGFLVDDHYMTEGLLPGIMQGMIFQGETDWIISGRDGKTVMALTGMPSGSLTVKSDFIGNFPEWTLEFYQADPRLLDAFLTPRRGVYFYMFILIAGILVFGLILTIRSLTREMELSKMKSDFVSTVSHEFKSPLTSIRQIAEMLHAGRVPSKERRQKYYDVLLEQSERLSLLTENVLSFAKMEEGKKEFVLESVDLDTLLGNIVSTVQDRVKHDGFTIEIEIEEYLPSIMADASAIIQAVNNLLDNAVKYSGDSEKVLVRAFHDEPNVVVQVIDFGLGIKKEDKDKIFDRFYRGGDELTRTVKGSGLGLTLVKQIVQAHKGRILVESEPKKGSVFTIKLPLDPNKGRTT
jgi:signal transduction histidine kinase/tetratricopeptide (TPR) repeat protein